MIEIQSRQNAALKHLARLGRERKYRRSTGEMLCEGEKMLTEALRSGAEIKTVLVRRGFESGELRQAEEQGAAMYCAEDALFCLASEVESPQNVIFSCMQPQWDAAALDDREQVLLLDGLQDPGNLGTILRTAEAFALGAVVLCEGCADPFSPKVVRSTMGAVFRLPCVQLPLADALARLKTAGLPVYATALHEDSVPLSSVSLGRAAVIIGSEGRGVSESALRLSDRRVIIPMHGRAEGHVVTAELCLVIPQARPGKLSARGGAAPHGLARGGLRRGQHNARAELSQSAAAAYRAAVRQIDGRG